MGACRRPCAMPGIMVGLLSELVGNLGSVAAKAADP
jgi:hypothetical protein